MNIDIQTIATLLTTVIVTLGGKEAWGYYSKRAALKTKERMAETANEAMVRKEIEEILKEQIADLKKQVADLTLRVIEMEKERAIDKKELAGQATQIALLRERLGKATTRSRGKKLLADESSEHQ